MALRGLATKLGGKASSLFKFAKRAAPTAEQAKSAAVGGLRAGGIAAGVAGAAAMGAGAAAYGGARRGWELSKMLFMAINALLFFTLLFHWRDISPPAFSNTYLRGIILIFVALYAWLFIFSKREGGLGDLKAIIPPLIISAIALIAPLILLNSFILRYIHMEQIFATILIFVPVWPIVIMFGLPTTRLVRTVRVIYILFIAVAFIPSAWYAISSDFNVEPMRVGTMGILYNTWENFKDGLQYSYKAVKEVVLGLPASIKKLTQEQIQYAVGDYYTGQVEEGKNQPVGVYLEDVQPAAMEFYDDETVVVWATLIARTLDPDKEITVTASCYGEKATPTEIKKEKGDADPLTESDVFVMKTRTEEEKFITCEFPQRFFGEGAKNIFINAEFNFETMAYTKAYFMNLETLRTMKRENIDPLDQYKITDKAPTAVFTNGPINLGMKTSDVPIGVSDEEPMDVLLGITLENGMGWEGRIKKVDNVTIKIPEPMEITYCDHAFEKTACQGEECEDGKYTVVYRIKNKGDKGKLGLDSIKDLETGYHSIACRMKVNDLNRLLGNYPLVTEYFKVTTDYVYELEKTTAVIIKKPITDTTDGTGAGGAGQPASGISFKYDPSTSEETVFVNARKTFSVDISEHPGIIITYKWVSTGVKQEELLDQTSYEFRPYEKGEATVSFIANDESSKEIEKRTWKVNVVDTT